jgi:predicted esterase
MRHVRVRAWPLGVGALLGVWLLWMGQPQAAIERHEGYELYVPSGVEAGRRYPLIIVLSPAGDTNAMYEAWFPVASKRMWFVLGSKRYTNDRALQGFAWVPEVKRDLDAVLKQHPIDTKRIAAGGLSGGGSASHVLAHEFPLLIRAVVPNTGRIWELYDVRHGSFKRKEQERRQRGYLPRLAVFLASPTDFRYDDMHDDKAFLERAGWTATWIEFDGGHMLAPPEVYERAAGWLEDQWGK